MGDRVLFQVVNGNDFSPIVYGHWSGHLALEVVERLRKRMIGRPGDLAYTTARLVQELVGKDDGNLGFGVWNATAVLGKDDSHGDAGIILIDCSTEEMSITCFGGYL